MRGKHTALNLVSTVVLNILGDCGGGVEGSSRLQSAEAVSKLKLLTVGTHRSDPSPNIAGALNFLKFSTVSVPSTYTFVSFDNPS